MRRLQDGRQPGTPRMPRRMPLTRSVDVRASAMARACVRPRLWATKRGHDRGGGTEGGRRRPGKSPLGRDSRPTWPRRRRASHATASRPNAVLCLRVTKLHALRMPALHLGNGSRRSSLGTLRGTSSSGRALEPTFPGRLRRSSSRGGVAGPPILAYVTPYPASVCSPPPADRTSAAAAW